MIVLVLLIFLLLPRQSPPGEASYIFLPFDLPDRHAASSLTLTPIGGFGIMRRARTTVPAHLHAGIDIRRFHPLPADELVYPIAPGKVISKRTDGPYAQLILEHEVAGMMFWSVYEHIAGISVDVGAAVEPFTPIARLMNKDELNRNGHQFDHLHLEVLKVAPVRLPPSSVLPDRHYSSYGLMCHTRQQLDRYYYNPLDLLVSAGIPPQH